jgi:D-alanyl-D-alanine carboxypeptidase
MRFLPALLLLTPGIAAAQCPASAPVAADGRILGHLPYGDVAPGELVPAYPTLTACRLRPEPAADFARLAAAAEASGLGRLHAASCHRSLPWQESVFCREAVGDPTARAISVAPPGHSEHATGYALDIAIRPSPNCPDTAGCIAALPLYRWLAANAARFGFEQSFPPANKQGLKWEPWHWRWVGTSANAPGAARARFIFARARRDYPASPAAP